MLILVVSAAEKDTGSTVGMEASAATSSLLQVLLFFFFLVDLQQNLSGCEPHFFHGILR